MLLHMREELCGSQGLDGAFLGKFPIAGDYEICLYPTRGIGNQVILHVVPIRFQRRFQVGRKRSCYQDELERGREGFLDRLSLCRSAKHVVGVRIGLGAGPKLHVAKCLGHAKPSNIGGERLTIGHEVDESIRVKKEFHASPPSPDE